VPKRHHQIGILSGLAALAGACSPTAQLKLAPDPAFLSTQVVRLDGGVLHGRVRPFRSLGGEFRAMLRLMRDRPDTVIATKTNSKGAFSFESIPVGRYRLVVAALGYRRAEYTVVAADSGASRVHIGMKPDPFSLDEICAGTCPPPPSGVITGSIRCAGQAGVVPPELDLTLADSVSRVLRAIAPVQTSGRFEISGVPLGAWRLEVNQRDKVLSVLHVRLVRDTLDPVTVRLTCR
jgi:hypothetical protein